MQMTQADNTKRELQCDILRWFYFALNDLDSVAGVVR